MISFEQRLSDSLNARIAKRYRVLGSSPVIVAAGASTAWLSPEEHELGSSEPDSSEAGSSELDSSELGSADGCFR